MDSLLLMDPLHHINMWSMFTLVGLRSSCHVDNRLANKQVLIMITWWSAISHYSDDLISGKIIPCTVNS